MLFHNWDLGVLPGLSYLGPAHSPPPPPPSTLFTSSVRSGTFSPKEHDTLA